MRKDRVVAKAAAVLLLLGRSVSASTPPTPEAETLRLSKLLRPVPAAKWQEIAGPRMQEKYEIVKGDTLWDISRKLFGEDKYWPKIWSLNSKSITNPHQIYPGMIVAFLGASGGNLPGFGPDGSGGGKTDAQGVGQAGTIGKSEDWRSLPRQSWETISLDLPPEIDPYGIDRRSKIVFKPAAGWFLPAIAASEELDWIGEIVGARSYGEFLSLGDTVFLKGEHLQVGDTVAITDEPYTLSSVNSDRKGFSYRILGQVKILTVRDGLFVGTIVSATDLIYRGSYLVAQPPRVPPMTPVNGQDAVEGTIFLDPHFSVFTSSQYRLVFVDRGTVDGVAPGMVFRSFQHKDPVDGKTISDSDFIISADFLVVQASERVSAAMVIRSLQQIEEGDRIVLLTDVSDLLNNRGVMERDFEKKGKNGNELDELDQLDTNEGLGADEAKELKQLEKYKESGPATSGDTEAPPPAPAPEPAPEELAPPADAPPPENGDPEAAPPPDASGSAQELEGGAPPPPEEPPAPPPPADEPATQ